jgi:2-methylisocitrate lyase-like PEP mutase family enzyme
VCCVAQTDLASRFLALHHQAAPLVIPNPWDVGSARLFSWLGFQALATTSSGYALTLGRADGQITRDQAIEHARSIAEATDLPVSADLENGFADDPAEVAATVTLACATGLAGCSIEDYSGTASYDRSLAADRVAAAVEAAHSGTTRLVLTARAENHIRGVEDLADTIVRLQSFQEAGADVLYAPGLRTSAQISSVLAEIDRPLNVLLMPGTADVAELGELGVKRVSVGGTFAYAGFGAVAEAARELLEHGTINFGGAVSAGRAAALGVLKG